MSVFETHPKSLFLHRIVRRLLRAFSRGHVYRLISKVAWPIVKLCNVFDGTHILKRESEFWTMLTKICVFVAKFRLSYLV